MHADGGAAYVQMVGQIERAELGFLGISSAVSFTNIEQITFDMTPPSADSGGGVGATAE